MQNKTLIFIPDISGFTQFINKTAIEHSQHIISELLEIILKSNKLELAVSEIEGDAILFYKHNTIPNPKTIIDQAKEMFINFHLHLNKIEKYNVCQCGACKTASNLSLKFITHFGKTEEVSVDRFNKLIGSDLILAHRLLKNKIESKEYLLFTESYLNSFPLKQNELDEWISLKSTEEIIDKFGKVKSKVIYLSQLLKEIPQIQLELNNKLSRNKPDIELIINAPIGLVHNKLIDHKSKYEFVDGLKSIETKDKINRINSTHKCKFDNFEINFVTKNNKVKDDKIEYTEEAKLKNGFSFITNYHLKNIEGKTKLSIYIYKPITKFKRNENIINSFVNYFRLMLIKRKSFKGIKKFKEYCEK